MLFLVVEPLGGGLNPTEPQRKNSYFFIKRKINEKIKKNNEQLMSREGGPKWPTCKKKCMCLPLCKRIEEFFFTE